MRAGHQMRETEWGSGCDEIETSETNDTTTELMTEQEAGEQADYSADDAADEAEAGNRIRRSMTIAELRERLGVAFPSEDETTTTRKRRATAEPVEQPRPRIVWRREELALTGS